MGLFAPRFSYHHVIFFFAYTRTYKLHDLLLQIWTMLQKIAIRIAIRVTPAPKRNHIIRIEQALVYCPSKIFVSSGTLLLNCWKLGQNQSGPQLHEHPANLHSR